MTFAYWMLIAAAMLPYLTIALAKSAGGIDNRAPRPSLETSRAGASARIGRIEITSRRSPLLPPRYSLRN